MDFSKFSKNLSYVTDAAPHGSTAPSPALTIRVEL